MDYLKLFRQSKYHLILSLLSGLFFLTYAKTSGAQTIKISITHSTDKKVFFFVPFGSEQSSDTCKPLGFKKGSAVINIAVAEPRFAYLHVADQLFAIYLEPHCSFQILLNSDQPDSISFRGQLAKENRLINLPVYKTTDKELQKELSAKNRLPEQLLQKILVLKKTTVQSFEKVTKQQEYSPEFIQLYSKELKYHFLNIFGSALISWYDEYRRDTIMKKQWIAAADKLYTTELSSNDAALNSQAYKTYLVNYMHYQLWIKMNRKDTALITQMTGMSVDQIAEITKKFNSELPLILGCAAHFFQGKTLQYYQASLILGGIERNDLRTVLYVADNYEKEYRTSPYLPILKRSFYR